MRSFAVLLVVAAAAVAQSTHPLVEAARDRTNKLPAVEFVFGMKSERVASEPAESAGNRLVFGGNSARVEMRHPLTGFVGTQPIPFHWIAATNGERVKEISISSDPRDPLNREGKISSPTEGVCRDLLYTPFTLAARGLDPVHSPVPADRLAFTGTRTDIDGVSCNEYRGTASGLPVIVWCDPAAGHTLRRFRQTDARGAVLMTIDVKASADNPAGVWLPMAYTVEEFDDRGEKWRSRVVTVERVLVGQEYPASEFDPPWPPGLLVEDQTTRDTYIAEDDGTLRHTHGLGGPRSWWLTRNWWAGVLMTVAVLSGGWLVLRKRRSARPGFTGW
jgi:hypothetical protein